MSVAAPEAQNHPSFLGRELGRDLGRDCAPRPRPFRAAHLLTCSLLAQASPVPGTGRAGGPSPPRTPTPTTGSDGLRRMDGPLGRMFESPASPRVGSFI